MTWINPISWASKLLRLLHIKSKTRHADLPRDIILDILSRLPAELIFKCQCESRPLQVLTTTPFFTHMQHQRSTSVIVVQLHSSEESPGSEFTKLCYMNKEFERIEEKFVRSLYTVRSSSYITGPRFLLGSYDGFLMFSDFRGFPRSFYMWNPITGEQLTMEDENIHVCGLYFNPVRKSHELLYYTINDRAPFGQICNFGAYNLRTKIRRAVGRFSYPPTRHRPPVIIKGTLLYWMIDRSDILFSVNRVSRPPFSDSIISFNTETEEFSTLEPGGPKYSTTEPGGQYNEEMLRIDQLHLSEMDGELCLCDFVSLNYHQLLLSIYNQATQCWSTRTIVIRPDYSLPFVPDWQTTTFIVEVVQIKDNELLLRQGNRLVLYDMISHSCKISGIIGSMDKGIRAAVHAHRITSFHL
ncbi:hypothetical protein MKW98_029873 [Papaver atlanticum]|uniref:F-box associated domain-containing protein n=1 Tax=Papaver atlanticum TaxID=357466 RepID=A0AAD4TJ64_9MAGN|nr:hypothetical protein MKW98_029873 [Papaver atlanticum]